MNTLLLSPADLSPDTTAKPQRATVRGRRARHLRDELGVTQGARLRIGMIGQGLGWGEVTSTDEESVEVAFSADERPPEKLPVTLVLGLPRPKVARRLLVDATAAGVARIVLLGTWRTPKSYWQSPLLTPERLRAHVRDGLSFGGDCMEPRVDLRPRFKPFAEDELPVLTEGATALLASPDAEIPCPVAPRGRVVLCIGPDRGFTDYEQDHLRAAGCQPVTLGPRTLRVHAATHFALGRLHVDGKAARPG